jgi:hypothetical protein
MSAVVPISLSLPRVSHGLCTPTSKVATVLDGLLLFTRTISTLVTRTHSRNKKHAVSLNFHAQSLCRNANASMQVYPSALRMLYESKGLRRELQMNVKSTKHVIHVLVGNEIALKSGRKDASVVLWDFIQIRVSGVGLVDCREDTQGLRVRY